MGDLPDGVEVLTTWLEPLGVCRSERPTGAVLPFIVVRRAGGGERDLVDAGRYQISVFHESEAKAAEFARSVRARLRLLASRFGGQVAVALLDGDVFVDNVIFNEGFRVEPYAAERNVYRVRAVVELHLRITT